AVALGRALLALVAAAAGAALAALVLPRDLRHRGLPAATRGHHFGSDASKVWRAIRRFVSGVLSLYYRSDAAVREDPELQAWVGEIFTRGFLGRRSSGVPSRLDSVRGLVTFVTTVIYTCSAHHAATNSGQFELSAFPERAGRHARAPSPPQGRAVRARLPGGAAGHEHHGHGAGRALGAPQRAHGHAPPGPLPRPSLHRGRPALPDPALPAPPAPNLAPDPARNAALERPYPYLDPENIENSVAI
ncbi:arachidonate 8S-lipoxygenase-like, partial [Camarhynchus parvulus]|uniref:arachidonate 8S-lipoxygenase-like n=1 Tax=Geospiza parvula TaxID=87175 RepID=UPI001237D8B4